MQPLLLRRTKDMRMPDGQPIVELPPRIEETITLQFSEEERDFYNSLYSKCAFRAHSSLLWHSCLHVLPGV